MNRSHSTIVQILKAVLPPESRARLFSVGLIRQKWASMVGRELALRSEPVSLREGILTVRVSDASWGRMILKLQREIIPRIDRAVELGLVKRLQFVRDGRSLWESSPPPSVGEEGSSRPTEAEPPRAVLEAARVIEDPELRCQLIRTASRYLARQAGRRR